MGRGQILAALLAAALLGGAVVALTSAGRLAAVPAHATVLPEPMALPDFDLLDHDGNRFTRDSLRGRVSLMFFGFTNCPDICPTTLQRLAAARGRLAEASDDPLPEILLISVDPGRDSVEALRNYVSHFGEGTRAATGSPDQLAILTGALGIYFDRSALPDGQYTVDHTAAVLVVNRDAELSALFGAPHDEDAFVHDLPILMAGE